MEVTQLGLSLTEVFTRQEGQNQSTEIGATRKNGVDKAPSSSQDSLETFRFSTIPKPVDMDEMLKYFEANNSQSIRQNVSDLKEELMSREDMDRFLMAKLFSLDEEDQQKELRRMLQELDQSANLEEILFGKAGHVIEPVDLEQEFQLNLGFELKLMQDRKEINRRSEQQAEIEMSLEAAMEADPLVLDLNGDGIKTTGLENGVKFDIDGDGQLEQSSFVSGDDFLLALDRNSNGMLDSGKELFGQANGHRDGIEELKSFDENFDGVIYKNDSVYQDLMLVNKNQPSKSLANAGVESISLDRLHRQGFTNAGDRYDGGVEFTLSNGQKRKALDIYFQMRNRN
ncbi:hypothetical protein HOF92_11440 [bacterium]|nr:hypothetical protein [bacterium]